MAHGIQLAVIDVLYPTKRNEEPAENHQINDIAMASGIRADEFDEHERYNIANDIAVDAEVDAAAIIGGQPTDYGEDVLHSGADDDDAEADDAENFLPACTPTIVEFTHHELGPLVKKVRSVVKIFKNSPVKNDLYLQPYIRQSFGKEIALQLDCKTRWSSMCDMLASFYKLRMCIKKALIDMHNDVSFSEAEFDVMNSAINALSVVKLAVEAVCRRDANLITADAAIQFMLEQLGKSGGIGRALRMKLERRHGERRTEMSTVLQYLHGRKDPINKSSVMMFVTELWNRLRLNPVQTQSQPVVPTTDVSNVVDSIEIEDDDEEIDGSELGSLKRQMDNAITTATARKSVSRSRDQIPENRIKCEVDAFDSAGVRGEVLEKVYTLLLNVPPTSVESERAFSASALVCTKLRCRLNDNTVDALCFLKAFFQTK